MKKNIYLWIFIVIAVFLCGALLIAASNNFSVNEPSNNYPVKSSVATDNNQSEIMEIEGIDLSQEDVDFEEDASDLADDFIDDSSFDDQVDLDSIENEIY